MSNSCKCYVATWFQDLNTIIEGNFGRDKLCQIESKIVFGKINLCSSLAMKMLI